VGTFIDASVANNSIEGAFAGIMAVGIIALSVDRMVFGMLDARIGRWRE